METTLGNVKPFAIDVKGGGKARKRRVLKYFHQCQRGRLLEILSLMEKEKKGAAPELSLREKNKDEPAIRHRRQTRSRGSKGSELKQRVIQEAE